MSTSRPRGFIDHWEPRPHVMALIEDVSEILDENSDILPLTLRQIFYMLVSNYHFEKTEQAYGRLCETLNRARRAQIISMSAIRDDGFSLTSADGWDDEQHLIDSLLSAARTFELNRQEAQPIRLFVWCEAAGMVPQLAAAVREYQIPVLSSGGFDSLTSKHDMARKFSDFEAVEILHIGDHDPSGVHLYKSLDEDLQAFISYYGGNVTVTRLAVTPAQVAEMDLPTAPPKRTDRRSFSGQTTQAEAIPPRRLREIVTEAVEARIDLYAHWDVLAREREIRERLMKRFEGLL